jgi:class 3 adenylate cyclase
MDVVVWLRGLGLGNEAAFRENEIDETVLPSLTHENLKELGVTALGHRVKLLDAIAALRADAGTKPPAADATTASAAQTIPLEDRAERRQVTVMFSDLVGSTALSARMDPEDLREIISAYQKCVAETVQRFGGFVAKYMGDGVLVYFGYPQAHEDDAERAVRAGLELIAGVAGLKTNAPLQTRVGIATGLVVVGDLIGTGSAQEQTVVGETPNLAARLQAEATPGTIAIDPTTRRLLGGLFEYRDLGGIEAKGFTNRVQAFEVVRLSMVESRFEALRTATTPLVGRDEEVDLLQRRWEQAKGGDGCVVLVSASRGSLRPSWSDSLASHTRGYAISVHRITRTARSIRASRSSNGRPGSGARIWPSSGSKSWKQSWPKGPMISIRSFLCWPTCCRSRQVTAIRPSISPRKSARRRRFRPK